MRAAAQAPALDGGDAPHAPVGTFRTCCCTQGLPWSLAAVAIHPSAAVACGYLGAYFAVRCAMTWTIGVWGLKQRGVWSKMPLIPVWDALAFVIWLASFMRSSVRWRGADYYIRDGELVPAGSED